MELTVLGANGWPGPGGACSGYLVRDQGFNILLDCGNGVLAQLQQHIGLDQIDAIFITHAHPDHYADLYALWVAVAFGKQAEMHIPLHAPPGFLDKVASVLSEDSAAYFRDTFTHQAMADEDTTEVGPFLVRALRVNHPADAVGFRVETELGVLAYSGDTGPTEALVPLAHEAGVFLCEATEQSDEDYPFHLTGTQAGQYAARADVGRLVLTHLWPSLDPETTKADAAVAFDGEIVVATSGLQMEVG